MGADRETEVSGRPESSSGFSTKLCLVQIVAGNETTVVQLSEISQTHSPIQIILRSKSFSGPTHSPVHIILRSNSFSGPNHSPVHIILRSTSFSGPTHSPGKLIINTFPSVRFNNTVVMLTRCRHQQQSHGFLLSYHSYTSFFLHFMMKSDQATSLTSCTAQQTALAVAHVSSITRASSAQASGFANISGLSVMRRAASLPSTSRSSSSMPSTSSVLLPLTPVIPNLVGLPQPAPTLTEQEQALQQERARQHEI